MGITPKKLVAAAIVALLLTLVLAGTAKSEAERAIHDLTTRNLAAPAPTAAALAPHDPQAASLLVQVAHASQEGKAPQRGAESPSEYQELLMAHWADVMDELGVANKATLLRVIRCESGGREGIVHWDVHSNSYGLLQFKTPTFKWMSAEAGIEGDPLDGRTAIRVADFALSKGWGSHWTCY